MTTRDTKQVDRCGVATTVAMLFAFAIFSCGADVTFSGNSWDGDLANPLNWPNGTIPAETGIVTVFGRTGALSLSDDLTVSGNFVINGQSNISAAFGAHCLLAKGMLTVGDYMSSNNNVDFTSGEIDVKSYFRLGSDGGSTNTFRIVNGGTKVLSKNRFGVGWSSNSCRNVLVVTNGADLTVSNAYACLEAGAYGSENLVLLDGAGSIYVHYFGYVGRYAGSCKNRMVVRNVNSAVIKEGFVVGNEEGSTGNSLLVTNVANLTTSQIIIGNSGACNTGEVYLVASESPALPSFKVGVGTFATNCYLLVDGGGNSYAISGGVLTKFTLGKSDTIEFRNITLSYGSSRYFDETTRTNSQFVIGKGATVTSTFTDYPPVNFRDCAPGYGITVDGGRLALPNRNGSIYFGMGKAGAREFAFTVKNNGRIELNNNFTLMNDGGRLDVLSGGELICTNFYCKASEAVITVSNATIRACAIEMPDSTFGGWMTNTVLRFVGTSPRVVAGSFSNCTTNYVEMDSAENRTGVIFEFVLPENGYETVPLEATSGAIWLCGKYCGMRVDASAYKGDLKWMPLMRAATTISLRMGENALCAGLPRGPELTVDHRIVTVDGRKELQIRVKRPKGLTISFR